MTNKAASKDGAREGSHPRRPLSKRALAARLKLAGEPIRLVQSPIPGMHIAVGGNTSSLFLRVPDEPPDDLKPFLARMAGLRHAAVPPEESFADRAREIRHENFKRHYGDLRPKG